MADAPDPRLTASNCPRCTAKAGDPLCYTTSGYPRPMHVVRRNAVVPVPGRLAARRPSARQHAMMSQALTNGGLYELSGYQFAGDAQRRAAMTAAADVEHGWFRHVRETAHGTLFELTEEGRLAYYRYEDWMRTPPRKER